MKKQLFKELYNCNVVYSFWMSSRLYAAIKVCRKKHLKCRIITRAHGYDLYCHRGPLPFRNYIGNNVDEIIFISKNGMSYYKDTIFSNLKQECALSVYYLGIDKEPEFLNYLPSNTLKIVSCSSVIQLKRLDIIIDALSQINDVEIEWTHFGGGDLFDSMKDYAFDKLSQKKNINYMFSGQKTNKEIIDFYRENGADIFVNASDTEGIPVSIMEALSFGIPTICRNVGGNSEINLAGSSRYLLDKNADCKAFAEAFKDYYFLNPAQKNSLREDSLKVFDTLFSRKSINAFAEHISNPF